MKKRWIIRLVAIVLAVALPIGSAIFAFAGDNAEPSEAKSTETSYENPDINKLTGHGEEPEEISVSAGATYQEKAWYEYVQYSEKAVASYRLNDDQRLLFYDPYTYTNSMIMDVQFDAKTTQFDTMSEYSISHTNAKTISAAAESTYTNTSAVQTSGTDISGTMVSNTGTTKTTYNHHEDVETSGTVTSEDNQYYYYKELQNKDYELIGEIASETSIKIGFNDSGVEEKITVGGGINTLIDNAWVTDWTSATHKTVYSPDYKTSTKTLGDDTVEYNTNSVTEGWSQLSARVTKTLGSSSSTNTGWSEEESTTVSKTYAATHFASDGVTPLPWAIVHYSVQMPMKCCLQVKHSGEWVSVSTIYCLLTTVQGTCRAWMQNGQTYYEDWGNGEPVVATDFWSQFMTREQLMKAYSDKLYPVGGED